MPSIAQIDLIETALAKSRAVPSAQAPVEDRGESKLVGSGSLVRAIQALRAAEVCIMRTIETREEEPEIAGRVLKIALENIETAKGHLCPNAHAEIGPRQDSAPNRPIA